MSQTSGAPGVTATEIDLSAPIPAGPSGTPAGIIGTAVSGPAFVPMTFASYNEFASIFGQTDGEKFGPLAYYHWMQQAGAGTYLRVLGVGDGKKRNDDGTVTNAGFMVGSRQVQADGVMSDNPFANPKIGNPASIVVSGFASTLPTAADVLKIKPDGSGTTQTIEFLAGPGSDETAFGASVPNKAKIYLSNHTGNMTSLLAAVATVWGNYAGYSATSDATSVTITSDTSVAGSKDLSNDGTSLTGITEVFTITAGVLPIHGIEGRTYFLGTFMSESSGCTIFSEAGIQPTNSGAKAVLLDAIDAGIGVTSDTDASPIVAGDTFILRIPAAAGGMGDITVKFYNNEGDAGFGSTANELSIVARSQAGENALRIRAAINGSGDSEFNVHFS